MKGIIGICTIIALFRSVQVAENYCGKETNVIQNESYIENSMSELSDEEIEQVKSETELFLSSLVVSDFLSMDSENFESIYDKKQLYEGNILYCGMNAWQYHGTQLDGYQNPGDYYDVSNITALRYIVNDGLYDFVEKNYVETASFENNSSTRNTFIQYMEDYAISIYFQRNVDAEKENSLKLLEISFVKVELKKGAAPKSLYQYLENGYYKVRESLLSEDWVISPDGNKEICVKNGDLPKHPAQIFVRCRENRPDTVFRFTWEQGIAGWIDEEHVVCYRIDWTPCLIHLETNQIEEIEIDADASGIHVFDTYGVKYEINGNKLIAKVLEEEVYCWNIMKENNEVYIMKEK